MLQFFKQYNPLVILPLIMLGVFLWMPFRTGGEEQAFYFQNYPDALYHSLLSFINESVLLSKSIGLLMAIFVAALMVQLNIRFFFLGERSYLPALFYMGIIGSFGFLHFFSPVYILSIGLLLFLFKALETYKYERIAYQYLDIGLLILIVSLFYFPVIFFIPLVWVVQNILRPFRWKESIFVIIGYAIPGLLLAGVLFFSDNQFLNRYISGFSPWKPFTYTFTQTQKIFLALVLVAIFLASIILIRTLISRKIHVRRSFQVFFTFFLYSVLLYLVIPMFSAELILIAAIPVSFLLSDFFIHNSRRRWVRVVFVFFWLVVLLNKIVSMTDIYPLTVLVGQ